MFMKTMVNKEKLVHKEEFGGAGGLLAQGKRQDQEEDEVFLKTMMNKEKQVHEEEFGEAGGLLALLKHWDQSVVLEEDWLHCPKD